MRLLPAWATANVTAAMTRMPATKVTPVTQSVAPTLRGSGCGGRHATEHGGAGDHRG